MDRSFNAERWLLDLRADAVAEGFEAQALAIDGRGGQELGLDVRSGEGLLQLRLLKRNNGPRLLVASTDPEITSAVACIFRRALESQSVAFGGSYSRFLERGLELTGRLESAFAARASGSSSAAGLPENSPRESHEALVARYMDVHHRRIEVLPGVTVSSAGTTTLAGIQAGAIVGLSELLPRAGTYVGPTPTGSWSGVYVLSDLDPCGLFLSAALADAACSGPCCETLPCLV